MSSVPKQAFKEMANAMRTLHQATYLGSMRQQDKETIQEYVNRFKRELKNVVEGHEQFKVAAFIHGLKPGELLRELVMKHPETIEELMQVAEKFARGEQADLRGGKLKPTGDRSVAVFMTTMLIWYPELRKVRDFHEAYKIAAFMNGLQPGELNRRLARDPPTSFKELQNIVERYIRADEVERQICNRGRDENNSRKRNRSNRNRN